MSDSVDSQLFNLSCRPVFSAWSSLASWLPRAASARRSSAAPPPAPRAAGSRPRGFGAAA
ncbi:hypothetical protein PybrP1_003997 [[Pythium] brassicae (nom. inval.)]|nr:hypothetical protein PybrP1_003997 [[Pythium] brassicae (nom. inval.)]